MGPGTALAALLVAAPFALATAFWDLRALIIPNWLTGAAGAAFLGFVLVALPLDAALWRFAGAALVLLVGFLLFLAGALGGGDAKAAAGFTLMIAPGDAGVALVLLAAAALIGLIVIALLRRTPLGRGSWAVWSARGRFPYGVALAGALLAYLGLVLYHTSSGAALPR